MYHLIVLHNLLPISCIYVEGKGKVHVVVVASIWRGILGFTVNNKSSIKCHPSVCVQYHKTTPSYTQIGLTYKMFK